MTSISMKAEYIYGTKKFIAPVYTIWKRSLFGKWSVVSKTENPLEWSNKNVLMECNMGSLLGPSDLLEAFKREQPSNKSFTAIDHFNIPGRGHVITVKCEGSKDLVGKDVLIDGICYNVRGVEMMRMGENIHNTIGLLVRPAEELREHNQ